MKAKAIVVLALVTSLPVKPTWANRMQDQLMKLNEQERKAIFSRFLETSGEPCIATRTFYQGKTHDDVFWNVACSNGKSYAVEIKSDAAGSTKILPCEMLKLIGNIRCFKAFSEQ